jgi:hypothetical protein
MGCATGCTGADGREGVGIGFARANDAASITCVRCGGGFACEATGGAAAGGEDPERGGFGILGMSCVPGAFFAIGGGGLVPVRGPEGPEPGALGEVGELGGMRSPAACWNAPRWDSALLTASGDTSGEAPPGDAAGPDGGFDVVAGGGP